MEFFINQIIGLKVEHKNAICLVDDEYVACAGAGVMSNKLPLLGSVNEQAQRFYFEPPSIQSRSPQSSPDLGKSVAKLVRINKAHCVAAHLGANLVACGEEVGYMPRLVLYNLKTGTYLDSVPDVHQFGAHIVKFSPSGKMLASIGTPQDGFLSVFDVSNNRLVSVCTNKCISVVNELFWLNDNQLLTVGVRHFKVWTIDSNLLNGRNMVLGSLLDQKFHSAVMLRPCNDELRVLVGTNRGGIYMLPGSKLIVNDAQRPIEAMCIVDDIIVAGTSSEVFKYKLEYNESDELLEAVLIEEFNFGAKGLYAVGDNFYYISNLGNLLLLSKDSSDKPKSNVEKLLTQSGLEAYSNGTEESTILYTSNSRSVLQWPENIIDVPLDDICTASAYKSDIIVGSLSGDVFLSGKKHNAHNGPVTDTHILEHIAASASRDRFVQIWVFTTEWKLKQTLNFPSPVLKLRLTKSDDKWSLVCACSNKTVYIYTTDKPTEGNESEPLFTESPLSLILKGMPFSMSTSGKLVVISCNDKSINIIDPWQAEKIVATWRPHDSNDESVNLVNIQCIEYNNQSLLLGSSSNKAVALYTLHTGEILACQYGYGDTISGIAWTGTSLLVASSSFFVSKLGPKREQPQSTQQKSPSTPKLTLATPRSSPLRSPSPSPERKIFAAPSRSRSISPMRPLPKTASLPARSASPPPRTSRPAPPITTRERGRPISKPDLTPNLSYKVASPPSTNPSENLLKALKEFVLSNNEITSKDEIKPLLISALNKVDGLALVNEFGDKLLELVQSKLK